MALKTNLLTNLIIKDTTHRPGICPQTALPNLHTPKRDTNRLPIICPQMDLPNLQTLTKDTNRLPIIYPQTDPLVLHPLEGAKIRNQ